MPLMNPTNNSLSEEQIQSIVKKTISELTTKEIAGKRTIQVFISHKFIEHDIKLASKIKEELNKIGIVGYLAEHKREYGYIISEKIKDAIRDSICVVVILTDDSIPSPSVNQELGYAMGLKMNIIPLVNENVSDKVGVLLNHVEGEPFNDTNFDEKCKKIVKYIADELSTAKSSDSDVEKSFSTERRDF